jgi:hypothetical protein
MKHVATQRKNLIGRNGNIWLAYCAGSNAAALAEAFDISEARVYQIIKQCERDFPPEEKDLIKKRLNELLDIVKAEAMEIALAPPKGLYAPNGKPLPEVDNSEKLAAIDRVLKIMERYSKINGIDSAVTHNVQVSAEAQQATKDQADKTETQFKTLITPVSAEVAAHAARIGKGG